jgi:hypothetical protein
MGGRTIGTIGAVGLALGATVAGCADLVTASGSAPPSPTSTTTSRAPAPSARPIDGTQAQRLQRVITPLVKAMDRPLALNKVKVGIVDDPQINAASAGGGELYVTRGLLEKADDRLAPIAGQLVMNTYTQTEEYAADRHGMEILQKAGMPPTVMADTLTWPHADRGQRQRWLLRHPPRDGRPHRSSPRCPLSS